jgi:hypothetical protein
MHGVAGVAGVAGVSGPPRVAMVLVTSLVLAMLPRVVGVALVVCTAAPSLSLPRASEPTLLGYGIQSF